MERHDENLGSGHSPATDFSQTPYLQNLKLHTFISIQDASQENCMRAVNRQPLFTARGTRRASLSRYTYPHRFHAYGDGARTLKRQPARAEQPKNVIKHVKNVENFGNSMSTLGNLK